MEAKNEKSTIPDELLRRYSEFCRLGSGAMGEVYRAHDSNLDINVAIKLLKMRQITPEMAIRFQQEAKVASKLKHHNLVTLLDFGISEKGEPYLIMENVAGTSLAAVLDDLGALPLPAAFNIMRQICDGMEHAHRSGIIHRDLKPSNVMVCGDDLNTATIKVLDFGIAKLDDATGSITQTGTLLGTPYYMSPEQFSGENVDRRTDVYAAGSILFRLLTNSHPFEGESLLEIMQDKRTYEAPRLSEVPLGTNIPPEIEEVVAKALAREQDNRYSSMKEFSEAMVLALDRIKIKLEQKALPKAEKRKSFDLKKMRANAQPVAIGTVVLAIIAMAFFVDIFTKQVQVVEAEDSAQSDDPLQDPISKKTFVTKEGAWVAQGMVHNRDLEWLAKNYSADIRELNLGEAEATTVQNRITTPGWAAIGRLGKLEKLSLINCFLDDKDMKYIAKIPSLKSIDLTRTGVGDKGIAFLEHKPITKIILKGTLVTDNCLNSLATMNLDEVSFEATAITDKGFEKISKLKAIHWLNLTGTKGTSDGLKYIGEMSNLEKLYIGSTAFGLAGTKNLSKLKRLKYLNADGDKTFDDQCFIAALHQWPGLTSLNLNNAGVTGKGLRYASEFENLNSLTLNACGLTDEDVMPITDIPKLEHVDLMFNAITDKTPERLATMRTLKFADLSHNQITQKGLDALDKAKIKYDFVNLIGHDTANEVMDDLLKDTSSF